MSSKNILVIEDDLTAQRLVRLSLEQYQFDVLSAQDGKTALHLLSKDLNIDAIILDLFLPDLNGLDILKKIRAHAVYSNIPVIILTSNDDKLDLIVALEMGADDYIVKPFHKRELVARLNACFRRAENPISSRRITRKTADIEVNVNYREVKKNGVPIDLTFAEFELLLLFINNPGRAFTRDELLTKLWGESFIAESRVIDMHISSLRKKLGDSKNQLIETIRGVGYRFRNHT